MAASKKIPKKRLEKPIKYTFGKILFITILSLGAISIFTNFDKYNAKSDELQALKTTEHNLRIRNEELRERLSAPIDRKYIEEIARKHGLRYQNEILFYIGSEK